MRCCRRIAFGDLRLAAHERSRTVRSFYPLMPSLPSVVIVGRPNVGKSTLFNAITGQRRSIVGDEPGITRDRIYGEGYHRKRKFELIDTGGSIPNDYELIPRETQRRARVPLEGAGQNSSVID